MDAFLVFERCWGYLEKGKTLTAKERPVCIHAFMKEHHRWDKHHSLGDLNAYNEQWWKWWAISQPKDHSIAGFCFGTPSTVNRNGLESCYGSNGLLLVMASLLWWGEEAHSVGVQTEEWWNWHKAVKDIVWTLEHMIRTSIPSSVWTAAKGMKWRGSNVMKDTGSVSEKVSSVPLLSIIWDLIIPSREPVFPSRLSCKISAFFL